MNEPLLAIENDGQRVIRTNYWDLPESGAGKLLVSINAGAWRVLLPPALEPCLADMATGRECVVSRGPWPQQRRADAVEILFDDDTDSPFTLHLTPESFDRLPLDSDAGKERTLTVWTRGEDDSPHLALERPCWYRRVARIPCLEPRA